MRIKQQSGTILLMILILISINALLTSAIVEIILLEMRVQANYLHKYVALKEAESALDEIKIWLNTINSPPAPIARCATIECISELIIKEMELSHLSWWKNNAAPASKNIRSYAFIRELQHEQDAKNRISAIYYQALVIGYSADKQAIAVIQTTFLKPFDVEGLVTKPSQQLSWQQLR